MSAPRATDRASSEVVGERCADAIVALCRIRAVFESGQMVFDHARRTAQVLGLEDRPQLALPDLAEQRDRLARALWGCGHVWRRASRESDGGVTAPQISPALAAGYDEHIAGAGSRTLRAARRRSSSPRRAGGAGSAGVRGSPRFARNRAHRAGRHSQPPASTTS